MRGTLLIGLGALSILAALGCGGAWEEATADAVSENAAKYHSNVLSAAESPERDQLATLLVDLRDHPENVGIIEIATFEVEINEALSDGEISASELSALQSKLAEIRKP